MRNSLFPIALAVLVCGLGLWSIRPSVGVSRGQGGPELDAGILGLPTRRPIRTASERLSGTTTGRLEQGAPDDGRWRVVVVSGADHEPMTRAVMLALGEMLYQADCVVILDPLRQGAIPAPPLPLPADRVVRITSTQVTGTEQLAGAWSATVALDLWQPRLPEDHPATAWQPPAEAAPARCVVAHHGSPAPDATGGWPERWAATGRAIAQAACDSLLKPGGVHPPPITLADWDSTLPGPPQADVVRWDASFQADLVRGWTGGIHGRTIPTATGASESALDPLQRLLASGHWQAEADSGTWRIWSRPKNGVIQRFALRPATDGWETTMWIERPSPADLVRDWLDAVHGGDAEGQAKAKACLARAAQTPALPEDLRAQAAAAAQ